MIYTVARTINSVRVSSTGTTAVTTVSKLRRPLQQITSRRNRQTDSCSKWSYSRRNRLSSNHHRLLRGRRQRCGCVRHLLGRIPKTVARRQLRRFRSLLMPTRWPRRPSNVGSCWSSCPHTSPGWWSCTCAAKKSTGRWVHIALRNRSFVLNLKKLYIVIWRNFC